MRTSLHNFTMPSGMSGIHIKSFLARGTCELDCIVVQLYSLQKYQLEVELFSCQCHIRVCPHQSNEIEIQTESRDSSRQCAQMPENEIHVYRLQYGL